MGDFNRAIEFVLAREGGYQCRPEDPGNWTGGAQGQGELRGTNFGISAKSYPNEDIRGMTVERAKEIYRRDYWDPCHGDELPEGISLAVMDSAVNQGLKRSLRWLQIALNLDVVDGMIGPKTIAAAHADTGRWLIRFLELRAGAYLHTLIENPSMRAWATNWFERLFVVEKAVLVP
jgi:lysozyme family protein